MQLGISPEYVLDRMEMYEVRVLLKNMHLKSKESWEQTRLMSYMTAQTNSTQKMEVKDIMTFPWEKEEAPEETQEERADVLEEMRRIEDIMNKKNNGK